MPLVYDSPTPPPTAADQAGMDQALSRLGAAADEADAAAVKPSGFTTWLLGNESAVTAAQENARQTRNLFGVMQARRPTISSHDDAVDFVRSCGEYANIRDILETVQQTDLSHAAATIASETASDVVDAAKTGLKIGLPILALAAVVVGGILVMHYLPRRA
jgi:hypothetical protein